MKVIPSLQFTITLNLNLYSATFYGTWSNAPYNKLKRLKMNKIYKQIEI